MNYFANNQKFNFFIGNSWKARICHSLGSVFTIPNLFSQKRCGGAAKLIQEHWYSQLRTIYICSFSKCNLFLMALANNFLFTILFQKKFVKFLVLFLNQFYFIKITSESFLKMFMTILFLQQCQLVVIFSIEISLFKIMPYWIHNSHQKGVMFIYGNNQFIFLETWINCT